MTYSLTECRDRAGPGDGRARRAEVREWTHSKRGVPNAASLGMMRLAMLTGTAAVLVVENVQRAADYYCAQTDQVYGLREFSVQAPTGTSSRSASG